jgi:hypothetical protein
MATVTDLRNPIKTRKATRPATGVCRWLAKPNGHHEGGVLVINGTVYEVLPLCDGEALAGYRLLKVGTAVMYDLPADLSTCDCPDRTFNPERPGGGCKHMLAHGAEERPGVILCRAPTPSSPPWSSSTSLTSLVP